jgi:integrase
LGIISKYIKNVNLDNRTARPYKPEKEYGMPLNKKKIRREITLNGDKVWITADTEQEYADKIAKLLSSRNTDLPGTHLFEDCAWEWFNVFSRPNIEEVTAITYKRQLTKHILPVLGGMMIENITPKNVQEVFNQMGKDASLETKKKCKNVLNQIFKMAVEKRIIMFNPLQPSTLRIKGPSSVTTVPYSVPEMRFFVSSIDEIENSTDRAWLALSICLPLRPEEVLGLRWQDIDENTRIIHVNSAVTHPTRNNPVFKPYLKNDCSVRDLMLPQWIMDLLPDRGRPLEFVIGGCSPLSYMQVKRMRWRIAKQIGYDGSIVPRRFRTTVATDISASTHDLKLVQHMLGHATPQMTLKHYDKGRGTALDATEAIGECYGF